MKAVIMAGGEGSRLRPLTSNRPKPMVPVGTVPIMEHTVNLLARQGFKDLIVTTFYLGEEIKSYFGDGRDFDVSMTYSDEPIPLGTAGAVKNTEDLLTEPFLIVSGDALTDCDFGKAIEFHKRRGALVTLILYRVPNPLEFGVVITNEEGKVTRFLEKPSWSEVLSDTVNTGMYIIDPKVFELMEPGVSYDWSGDVFPALLEKGQQVYGYTMSGYWCDVGSLNQYKEAHEHLLQGFVKLPLPGLMDDAGIQMGSGCSIDDDVRIIPPVVLGRNVKIKRGAKIGPFTTISDNCLIEEYASIERSTIWESVYVGNSASLRSAIVCARATLKKDVSLMDDSVVGDRCVLDVGTIVRPRVKLWPDKIIERGSTVTMSMIWGHKWRGNLFRELGVAGISNIEMTPEFATRLGSAFGSCFPLKSQIVTSRDSSKSSRMLKRAMISSLLSVGCDILDLRNAPLPVTRHFIRNSSGVAAMNVRKLPGNSRVSLIEMFDQDGDYLSKVLEKKVESLFFREDYKRTDADDIGVIEFSSRAIEEYESDFLRLVRPDSILKNPKVVCNYGYAGISNIFPSLLGRLGIESISLNAFNDARRAPRSPVDIETHLQELAKIVGTLRYDMGVLFLDEAERMILVDNRGEILDSHELFATFATLYLNKFPSAKIALPVHMPHSLITFFRSQGRDPIISKANTRSLMKVVKDERANLGGDERGGFIFPEMSPGFDAATAFGWLVMAAAESGHKLSDIRANLPKFPIAYESAVVHWEQKGMVMRRLLDWANPTEQDLFDGVRIHYPEGSALILPDAFEPLFHVYAEGVDLDACQHIGETAVRQIQSFRPN
jgi:mannose-1-phosphate guanylyltransferase / phosphomannomutase